MTVIYCELVPDAQRLALTASLFGLNFPLRLEPFIFSLAERLSPDYRGGFWHFCALSNGGFYMAPQSEGAFAVRCENGFEGSLSADAFGVTVCLYAFSQLSFSGEGGFSETCSDHFHLLREHMLGHGEVRLIAAAID